MLQREIAPEVLTCTHPHKTKGYLQGSRPRADRQWTACRKIACPLCILDVFICPGHSRSNPRCFDLIYCRIHLRARKKRNGGPRKSVPIEIYAGLNGIIFSDLTRSIYNVGAKNQWENPRKLLILHLSIF